MVSVKFIIHIYFLVQNMWISRENLWQLYNKDPEIKNNFNSHFAKD